MSTKCPKCQTDNTPGAKFCSTCGLLLDSIDKIPVAPTKTMETPAEELTTGSTFASRYQIIEELGKGGMGRVYKALDKEINEKIALKLIKPEIATDEKTIERFRNELKTARKIGHKNVCRMYDLNKEKGSYYITMEFVDGGDLKRFIRRSGQLSVGKALSIAKQICDGLSEAHELGIVHRDLKPNNIMIDDNGNARIMDFGIARTTKGKGITGSGILIGTPEYMSPEQVEAKDIDVRSDIYSLGVVMYEMLTGRLPFEAETALAVGVKHKSETPKAPKELNPSISDALNNVILKCLEKERENRYQSALELRSELEKIEQGLPTTDRVIPQKKPLTSREITVSFNIKKLLWPGLLVIAVLAAVVLVWKPWSKDGQRVDNSGQISLAVLPFEDLSPTKDQGSFCDGMMAEIISKLAMIEKWRVIPATTMYQYRETEKGLSAIAQELNVGYILEGQLSREEDDLRVIAGLFDVKNDRTIPAYNETSNYEKTFEIQTEIAEKIALELEAELSPEEKLQMEKPPTMSLEAFDLYNKGIEYYLRLRDEDNEQAIKLFQGAIELDPQFAQAYARLADAYRQRRIRFGYPDSWLDESIKLAEQALDIDPDCAEAYQAIGAVHIARGRNREAIKWEQIALKKNPNLIIALANLGSLYIETDDVEQAYFLIKRALDLDPSRAFSNFNLGFIFLALDEYQKAEELFDKALLFQPDLIATYRGMIWCQILQEQYDRAMEYAQKFSTFYPDSIGPQDHMATIHLFARDYDKALEFLEKTGDRLDLGSLYLKMGRREEGERLLNEHLDRVQALLDRGREGSLNYLYIATNYAVRGEREKAYEWLERASEAGWVHVKFNKNNPFWEEFYEDERYKQIYIDINKKVESIRRRILE